MKVGESSLKGAYLVTLQPVFDERGSFARTFCRQEFGRLGLLTDFPQNSISENTLKGTLRGMHYQDSPSAEVKLVQCVRGALYDVIIDLRPTSDTYCGWEGFELSAANRQLLYIPEGFAHGFVTLEDDTAVYYLISEHYRPELARGVRYNDPAFAIKWPEVELIMSERDRLWPDYKR
jgi:dTDP-4-dehydrorhamnose 3,5-epimerase